MGVSVGYDSDVAREKSIDYTTKIYAVSIRDMCGIKPHQQLKEVSAEERYTPMPASVFGLVVVTQSDRA